MIPWCVAGNNGALVCRDSFDDTIGRRITAKYLVKLIVIAFELVKLRHDFVSLRAHVGARPCGQRLFFERPAATVPVKLFLVTDIPERWTTPRELLVERADSFCQSIRQTLFTDMAGVTRARAVAAKSFIEEKLAAQRNLFGRHWVIRRNLHRRICRQLLWKRLDIRYEVPRFHIASDHHH